MENWIHTLSFAFAFSFSLDVCTSFGLSHSFDYSINLILFFKYIHYVCVSLVHVFGSVAHTLSCSTDFISLQYLNASLVKWNTNVYHSGMRSYFSKFQ